MSNITPNSGKKIIQIGAATWVGCSLLILIAVWVIPYQTAQNLVDLAVDDGQVESLPSFYYQLRLNLFFAGGLSVIGGLLLFFCQPHRTWQWMLHWIDSLKAAWTGSLSVWRRFLESEEKSHLIMVMVVLLLSTLIRIAYLQRPIMADESSFYLVTVPFYRTISVYSGPNNHVFHSVLAHFSSLVFGSAPWATRLPALFAGILIMPLTYLVARKLWNKEVGLIAAALAAISSILIDYSTLARGYTLLTLCFLILIFLADHLRRANRSRPATWFLFSIVTAVGFFTMPTMLYAFGAITAWLSLEIVLDKAPNWKQRIVELLLWTILAGVLTILLYSPMLLRGGLAPITANQWITSEFHRDWFQAPLASTLEVITGPLKEWNREFPTGVAYLIEGLALLGLVMHKRMARHRVPLIVVLIIVSLPVLIVQEVLPPARVWLFFFPVFASMVGAGLVLCINLLRQKFDLSPEKAVIGSTISLIALLLINLYVVRNTLNNSDVAARFLPGEEVSLFLRDRLRDNDLIFAQMPAYPVLQYYFWEKGVSPKRLKARWHNLDQIQKPGQVTWIVMRNDPNEAGQRPARLHESLELLKVSPEDTFEKIAQINEGVIYRLRKHQ